MTSEWIRPATRPELIENLVSGVDRYNPSNIGILEDYLYHQIRSQEYDCLANLAILKLYQFNPDLYNPDVLINILIKSLTVVPSPDFHLCLSLLEERSTSASATLDDPDPLPTLLPSLITLHSLLYRCRFPAFWKLYHSDELENLRDNYTVECVGFEDDIRTVVVRTVKAAFTSISADRLASYLDLPTSKIPEFVEKLQWSSSDSGKTYIIPPNPDNQIEAHVLQEDIKLTQLTKVISQAGKV